MDLSVDVRKNGRRDRERVQEKAREENEETSERKNVAAFEKGNEEVR